MSSNNYASMQEFKDVRELIGTILIKLAKIADERKEEIIDKESAMAKIADNGDDFRRPLADVLKERAENVLSKEAFQVAVIGKFNAGKSTLINALLGHNILSVDCLPKTAAKTILQYGEEDAYKVTYQPEFAKHNKQKTYTNNLAKDIEGVTSDDAMKLLEDKTESLAKQIEEVEIWCKSEFLDQDETKIFDTPGLESPHKEHGEVTNNLIPEMDAILFLFPTNPGVGQEEINLLKFISYHTNQLLFIMTKLDTPEDKEKKLDYNKKIIESKAQIPVERIYGVSAKNEIEGKTDESGFNTFVEALESFLVSSRGVARLIKPFEFAQTHCQNLIKNTQIDIERIDKDVKSLKNDLEKLKHTKSDIENRRDNLLINFEQEMKKIVDGMLDGIENLPTLIETDINDALNKFDKESLQNLEIKLQITINETVDRWVKEKENNFRLTVELLLKLMQSELNSFVEMIDNITLVQMPNTTTEFNLILDTSILEFGSTKKNLGTFFQENAATLIGFIGVQFLSGRLFRNIFSSLLLPELLSMIKDLFDGEKYFIDQIKKKLKEPILPNSNVNRFEAIVEGYLDEDDNYYPGVRQSIEKYFDDFSYKVKSNINNFVDNLVNSQITQIEKQINDKESNTFNRNERLQVYAKHQTNLEKIDEILARLKTQMERMSSSNAEESI